MCKLFIKADPTLWENTQRSLRIDGMVTSIRMENTFWHILEEVARRDSITLPNIITRLFHESIDAGHAMGNFTSFVRVCCSRYLTLQLNCHIPRDQKISVAGLDADTILHNEKSLH
jgi:predicted DNA-binding ribbon-helix-helix protein